MSIKIKEEELLRYSKDNFYFCEEKVLAGLAKYYGHDYELMFLGTYNFSYHRQKDEKKIGMNLCAYYNDSDIFLKKYHGIQLHKIKREDEETEYFNLVKQELKRGNPVVAGLNNSKSIWPLETGLFKIRELIFIIYQIDQEENLYIIDVHDAGRIRCIPRDVFEESCNWCTTVKENALPKEIKASEILRDLLSTRNLGVKGSCDCNEIIKYFPSISPNRCYKEKIEQVQTSIYERYMQLAEDVKNMSIEDETEGFNDLLFTPFYFDALTLFRTRIMFAKAMTYVKDKFPNLNVDKIIQNALASGSKWNEVRWRFSELFGNKGDAKVLTQEMSKAIASIAKNERVIELELEHLYNKELRNENARVHKVNLHKYQNAFIFAESVSYISKNISYGRYILIGEKIYGKQFNRKEVVFDYPECSEQGDAVLCQEQRINIEKGNYKKILIVGTVLDSEMLYDMIEFHFTDGSTEEICIGFEGWTRNEFVVDKKATPVWKGTVQHTKGDINMREISIFASNYELRSEKELDYMILPHNNLIALVAISLYE
ncbi:MAG TPA: hypothetical protein DCW90_16945 [Lachnospiraceae bacterium]|nr:hypothetical protein [uncultured Lachnoclostridium sp.]HAU87106.1 hypothetical protein [Lachnospiraceae bacterium]